MARDFESSSSQFLRSTTTPVTVVPLTISAWIKPETTAASRICGIYDSAADLDWFEVRIGGAGPNIQASTKRSTEANAVTSTVVVAGTWQHVCATFASTAGTDRAVYLNGTGVGTNTTDRTPASLDRVGIGVQGSATATAYFDGLIAEVTIWSVELRATEIESLGNRAHSLTIRPASIVAYWPLWGLASPEIDYSGGGCTMTVTGATASTEHPPVAPLAIGDIAWQPYTVAAVVPDYVRPTIVVAPSVPVTQASRI